MIIAGIIITLLGFLISVASVGIMSSVERPPDHGAGGHRGEPGRDHRCAEPRLIVSKAIWRK